MRQEDRRKKYCRSEEPHISHASRHCSAMELPPKPLVRNAPMSDKCLEMCCRGQKRCERRGSEQGWARPAAEQGHQ